ncbi:MAG: ribosome-binding factor A [Flavobacteriales bacterium]|nr:ribosome-binding factor A [Flavobacteriales bacterium]
MDSVRLKKIESLLGEEFSELLRVWAKENMSGVLISVPKVNVTPDLSISRVNVSVFPVDKKQEVLKALKENTSLFRGQLGDKVRHQLRKIPQVIFYLDESVEQIEAIEKALRGEGENPIKK